jgi:type IV secretion system protein TrbF
VTFPFRSPAKSFAPEAADTPYRRAQQEWDARMGSAVLSARSWRSIAFVSVSLAGLLAASLTMVALQKRTFVYVAESTREGQVTQVRPLDGSWTPNEAQIAYHLGRFVRQVRALPTDGVVLRENWLEAYKFLTPKAAAHLSEIARADDPFQNLGRVGRTVHINSIIARSDKSWEVRWTEKASDAPAGAGGDIYSGVFTISVQPPDNADAVAANPLGLLISDFSWSRER